jgi:hypothetical protein
MRFIFILLFLPAVLFGQQKTSLSIGGSWQFSLDSLQVGEAEKWYDRELPFTIDLPGSVDQGGFGKKHINGTSLYDGKPEIYRLARKQVFIGAAWYRKTVDVPQNWNGKQVFLSLERCMWQSKLWINASYVGENNSLCTPHQYELNKFLKQGKNVITIKIDNSPQVNLGLWSHGYSPELQTIWNGIIGKIELSAHDPVHVKNIQVYSSYEKQQLNVKLQISSPENESILGRIEFAVKDRVNNKTT